LKISISPEAEAVLSHLDKPVAQRIVNRIIWLDQHVEDISHKALTGNLRGAFKLRVGDYRVIYEIDRNNSILVILLIGHRSEIYK
jgi:mRNA interferase RelE/StbE